MVKEIKIGDKVFTFKENLLGLDLVASFEDGSNEKKALVGTVGLMARASQNPKLSTKDILMMPYGEFVQLIKGFARLYGVPGEFDFLEEK